MEMNSRFFLVYWPDRKFQTEKEARELDKMLGRRAL